MAIKQRVEVTRAFRVSGSDVGEGSVIDLDLPTAQEARNARKAVFVPSDAKLAVLPLKEKTPAETPENQQISALQSQVSVLTALVEKLGAKAPAGKEKANA